MTITINTNIRSRIVCPFISGPETIQSNQVIQFAIVILYKYESLVGLDLDMDFSFSNIKNMKIQKKQLYQKVKCCQH